MRNSVLEEQYDTIQAAYCLSLIKININPNIKIDFNKKNLKKNCINVSVNDINEKELLIIDNYEHNWKNISIVIPCQHFHWHWMGPIWVLCGSHMEIRVLIWTPCGHAARVRIIIQSSSHSEPTFHIH